MKNEIVSITTIKSTLCGKILAITLLCLMSASAIAQDITNTLAPGGKFIVKDAANNYLVVDQLTGHMNVLKTLRLENTTSPNLGVIYMGADRFIHNFGTDNTFIGKNSGNFTMTGNGNNTAIGNQSLYSNTAGYENTALGTGSLYSNTVGWRNTVVGYQSLNKNTIGTYNTAIGNQSLYSNTSGYQNIAVGYRSLYSNTTGNYNTALGNNVLYSNTGYANTAVGYEAGSNIISGNNVICLGYDAQPTSGSASNQITLGNEFITSLRCNVQNISALSDARDKKNIMDLDLGIDFLMKIKPRQFNWDRREWYEGNISDGSKMQEAPTAGFIAQELDEAQTNENAEWLNLVLKDNPEKWEATPGNLLPIIVKAIQELKTEKDIEIAKLKVETDIEITKLKLENDELNNNNEKLSAEVALLKSMSEKLATLEQMVNELTSIKQTSYSVAK